MGRFYIYKILSNTAWQESQKIGHLQPGPLDTKFIHLCEKHQVPQIVSKFWSSLPITEVMVAKLEPKKLIGTLVKECNPGGSTEYYHLYDGQIPLAAVIQVKPYSSI